MLKLPPLISADVLLAVLSEPALYVLDIRSSVDGGGSEAFQLGHVPGATHTDYVKDGWRQKIGNVPGLLPEPAHLTSLFSRLGLRHDHAIVIVYAGVSPSDLAAATRVYWTLKLCGLKQISILDGGYRAWSEDETRPVETGDGRLRTTSSFEIKAVPTLRSDLRASFSALQNGTAAFVDARALSYFDGREKASEARVGGHIPGALNRDYSRNYDPLTGGLKPLAQLTSIHDGVPDGPVISYCNTGHTAALNWFVLSELLQKPQVSLFEGSMTEWTQDDAHPVEV